MSTLIQITDVVAGFVVLMALFLKFRAQWIWFLYALACWSYMVLNYHTGLFGQATMNLVAGIIAARNAWNWKPGVPMV